MSYIYYIAYSEPDMGGAGDSSDVGRWRCDSAKGRQSVHSHMPRQNELPLP